MKTLVCFGNSWPQGGKLKDQTQAYGYIGKDRLNFDQFFNYGLPGYLQNHKYKQSGVL